MSSFISSSPSAHSSRTNLLPDPKVDSRGSRTASSISDKFSLSADPASWGASLHVEDKEPDDYLHNPDPRRDKEYDAGGSIFTLRGLANLGCISILCAGLIGLFGGYPIISYFTSDAMSSNGGFNLGGINGTGQVPSMGNWGLIDQDTPTEAYTRTSYESGDEMLLVFSDEFNEDGRTFYPGEDPYWEAVDLHYWVTNNLEWYDPIAITTEGGALRIRLEDIPTRGMDYRGGMMTSWNKFCFTGGLVEVSVTLPGANNIAGLWPAVWALGNLGRAAYGATLEGMWPYTYDSCDVGTVGNQTLNGQPELATVDGDSGQNGALSFLPGQRLSRCTCPGESHPGPMHADGTYVGRSAPEIDIFEAQVANGVGDVSQSGQWAPFNYAYEWHNTSDNYVIYDEEATHLNTYKGGVFQQATSAVSKTNQDCYELETGCFSTYGFEYKPGYDDAYLLWISDNKPTWLQRATGMEADPRVEISARPVPQEPMYLLANLGMSNNFGFVDLENIIFPATMSIDWIRVYQKKGEINIGCDPASFPTQAYINEYIEAYTNPNLTTWEDDYKQPMPKNSFLGQC